MRRAWGDGEGRGILEGGVYKSEGDMGRGFLREGDMGKGGP